MPLKASWGAKSLSAGAQFAPGDLIIGRGVVYLVVARLGSGTSGEVFSVVEQNAGITPTSVIKAVRQKEGESDEAFQSAALRELGVNRLLDKITSGRFCSVDRDGVCSIDEWFSPNPNTIFIRFPFNDSVSFKDYIEKEIWPRTLSGDPHVARDATVELLNRFVELLNALGHMHTIGFSHRDLAPRNVIVTRGADGSRRAMLIDFGLGCINLSDLDTEVARASNVDVSAVVCDARFVVDEIYGDQRLVQADIDSSTIVEFFNSGFDRRVFDIYSAGAILNNAFEPLFVQEMSKRFIANGPQILQLPLYFERGEGEAPAPPRLGFVNELISSMTGQPQNRKSALEYAYLTQILIDSILKRTPPTPDPATGVKEDARKKRRTAEEAELIASMSAK